jgi:hypothetical protein
MPQIVTNGYGHLHVKGLEGVVGNGPGKVVSVKTGSDPADLTEWEMYDFIEKMLEQSGVIYEKNPKSGVISIYRPLSPAEVRRRDELAVQFGPLGEIKYANVAPGLQKAIDHIIQGEFERGELK